MVGKDIIFQIYKFFPSSNLQGYQFHTIAVIITSTLAFKLPLFACNLMLLQVLLNEVRRDLQISCITNLGFNNITTSKFLVVLALEH